MNKKVHFYFPKKKIDVENQTFFDDYERVLHNDNIYERQYQAALNSLFDYEPPENEIEKMIKFDYSSRIEFFMTKLHDDRFDPLTPSNELFSNATPQICLDIRNDGFVIWKYESEATSTDQTKYLSFSFDNDAEVIYSIVESFFTGRINFPLLRIIDRLRASYNPSGNILCEVIDSRFLSESTYLYDFDEENVSKKRINLCISNSAIYYHFTLARQSFIRKKNVHINNEVHSLNNDSTNFNRSLSTVTSVPNVTNSPSLSNPSTITPDSFQSIKRNDSTPNLINNSNLNQLNTTQMLDNNSGIMFNQVKNEPLSHNKFQSENNKIMMNHQNHSFNLESSQKQMNEYFSSQNTDPSLTQMNGSITNQNFNDSSFQVPIQSMGSRPIQGDNQPQIQFQNQYGKQQQQQIQKQKQQQQKQQHSHTQKQQHQLQKMQQLQKQQLLQQQQQSFQQFQVQNQSQTSNIDLPINNSNNQEEPPPKNKSRSNLPHPQSDSNGLSSLAPQPSQVSGSNVIYEAERKLILLLNPTFISDPSPDVCRVSSILDFREKMWNQAPSSFINNYDQMKSRFSVDSKQRKSFNANLQNRQSYQFNSPREKITIPDTISQMFISKNMIKFTTY